MDPITLSRTAAPIVAPVAPQPGQRPEGDDLVKRPVTEPGQARAGADSDRGVVDARRAGPYSEAERARIEELRARDREVRAHERAHLAAAGPHAQGGAQYTFTTGPDRRRYAVGGEVQIDTSPVSGDPAATLNKALQVQRAALAPAEPSAQDRRVAAQASAMAAAARAEMARERAANDDDQAADTQRPAAAAIDLLA